MESSFKVIEDMYKPSIVLVSTNEDYLDRMLRGLALWGYIDVHALGSSVEALALFETLECPAIFLLDDTFSADDGLDGIRLARHLKERNVFKRFSVACGIMFKKSDHSLFVEALDVAEFIFTRRAQPGGEKYNIGPLLRKYLMKASERLRIAQYHRTDHSTGMLSSSEVEIRLETIWKASYRDNAPMSGALVDIDDFKIINTTHGHQAGDEVIALVAERLHVRPEDIPFRSYKKGDEFVILLPRTPLEEVKLVAQRIRQKVEETPIVLKKGTVLHVTISIGVASINPDMGISDSKEVLKYLVKHADADMYKEKNAKKMAH